MIETLDKKQQQLTAEFIKMLRANAADNLLSVVLYGSAASDEYSPQHSDVNLLCLFQSLSGEELARITPALRWWEERGRAALVLTLEELHRSADVFAIEMLDIQGHHRVLVGQDYLSSIHVPLTLHRVQVERELRTAVIRLRQRFIEASKDNKRLLELMLRSASTYTTLFRHALIALGHEPLRGRHAVVDKLQTVLQIDVSPLRTVLDLREGKLTPRDVDVALTFSGYLRAICAVVDEVDRRFDSELHEEHS